MSDTDLTFPAAPVMTQSHCDAMRWVVSEWPYANVRFDRHLLDEIHQHLAALLAQPVPSREHELTPLERITHASNYQSFPDRLLAANQDTINQIVAMSESDQKDEPPKSPFVMPSWAGPHPELRERFAGAITIPGPLAIMMRVEAYDPDGTPVTYEGEVTKTIGHAMATAIPFPDDDEDEDDEVPEPPIVNPRRIAADGTLRYNGEHQPGQNTSSPADWRREYTPPTAEDCYLDCDQ